MVEPEYDLTKTKNPIKGKSLETNQPEITSTQPEFTSALSKENKEFLDDLINQINKKIDLVDLNTHRPPYISNLFYIWRWEAYKSLEKRLSKLPELEANRVKMEFINRVDGVCLLEFLEKCKQPYFNRVFRENYNMPVKIPEKELEKNKYLYSDLRNLSERISRWCILIEQCADSIERSILYGFYDQDDNKIYYEILKEDKAFHKKNSIKSYTRSLLNKSLVYSVDTLSKMLWSKGFTGMTLSYAGSMAMLYWLVGAAAFPWGAFLGRIQISWLLGGLIGSKALNSLSTYLEGQYKENEIKEIENMFERINLRLIDFEDSLRDKIKDCLLALDRDLRIKKKEDLKYFINEFLDDNDINRFSEADDLALLGIEKLDIREEGDWTVVDPKKIEIKEEELEDGFTKLGFF